MEGNDNQRRIIRAFEEIGAIKGSYYVKTAALPHWRTETGDGREFNIWPSGVVTEHYGENPDRAEGNPSATKH